jgi:hypothetical protein
MTKHVFVPHLPDLIDPQEYADDPEGKTVRVRIRMTEDGVEILGDGTRAESVESLLEALAAEVVEQMLCG